MVNKKMNKNLLFEYLVFRLDEWKKNIENTGKSVPAFTKLRLQKILFLVCAWNATNTERKLLNVFNNFYDLPYGPVEMDVYEDHLQRPQRQHRQARHLQRRGRRGGSRRQWRQHAGRQYPGWFSDWRWFSGRWY